MNLRNLHTELIKHHVPEAAYHLEGGLPNERFCIGKNDEGWEVYYSERGNKTGLKTFESENAACVYFLTRLLKYRF